MLKFKSRWMDEALDAKLVVDNYVDGGGVYIGLWVNEDGYFEPWCDVTVNLPYSRLPLDDGEAYVDVNNCPELERFITENGLGESLHIIGSSGWCSYPLYRFNMDEVRKHLMGESA